MAAAVEVEARAKKKTRAATKAEVGTGTKAAVSNTSMNAVNRHVQGGIRAEGQRRPLKKKL